MVKTFYGVVVNLSHEGKQPCPKCRSRGKDRSGDNLHVYGLDEDGEHKGAHCYACEWTIPSKKYLEESGSHNENDEEEFEPMGSEFNEDVKEKLKTVTSMACKGYRGIRDDISKKYRVRYMFDAEDGTVQRVYYPTTEDWVLTGYKVRTHPKDFKSPGPLGETGKHCELFGQFLFKKSSGKYLLITSGEHDALAAFQMLEDYRESRGQAGYDPIPVVSPTIGEAGAYKQIQANYEWINRFERVIYCKDPDDAGDRALERIAKVLPKKKLHVMELATVKDPNEALERGKSKEFISKFFAASPYVPSGIVGSAELMDKMKEAALTPKVPLPPFMHKVQGLMAGGIPLKKIVCLGSASGCVDRDTEYLTPKGWKRFDEYSEGDLVAQYHKDGSMTFVEPKEYVKLPCKSMTRFRNRSTDQVLSDEHRFVYYTQAEGGDPKIKPFREVKEIHKKNQTGFRGHIATTFKYSGTGVNYTEGELRLQVAVMADGRVVSGGKDNYTQFRVKKERKYNRLKEILNRFGLRHDDRGQGPGGYYEVIVWPKNPTKSFTSEFYNATQEQLQIICDEVMHWDGYLKNNVYTSCRKGDVDFLQFAFAACGKRAVVGEDKRAEKYKEGYCGVLNVNKGSKRVSIRGTKLSEKARMEEYPTEDGYKYCFMVETGMLVLRRSGRVFITGNTGKSTIIDEMVYDWLFNSPHKVGVLSLESDSAEYGTKLLSRHVSRKIDLIESPEDKFEYLSQQEVEDKATELFRNEDGNHRFHIIEERDGTLESVKDLVMQLVIECEAKIVIVDPLQDLLEGTSNEEQATFMKWLKGMTKSHDVTFILVNHVRKNSGGTKANSTGADIHEEDFQGSSSIFKSSSCNLLFTRNKEHPSELLKNITTMKMTKCRWSGRTSSQAGQYYYCNETHTLYDLEDYLDKNPEVRAIYEQALAEEGF